MINIFSPKSTIFLPLALSGAVVVGLCAFVYREATSCPYFVLGRAVLAASPWAVEVKVRHCNALDDEPYEIVAINAATGKTYEVAKILEYASPNLVSFDAMGRLVVTVPHGAAVRDRHDSVGDLRVVYRNEP